MSKAKMEFEFELFVSENGTKMIYISAEDSATGAEYPYETTDDIGKAIAKYLETYYAEEVRGY